MRLIARIFLFLSLILATLGPAMAHYQISSSIFGAYLFVAGLAFGVISLVFSILSFFTGTKATLSFVFGIVFSAALGYGYYLYEKFPITDLSTNRVKIPEFKSVVDLERVTDGIEYIENHSKVLRPYNPIFRELQALKFPEISPQNVDILPDATFELVLKTLKTKHPNWKIIFEDKVLRQVEAEAKEENFHFTDDFLVVVSPWETSSSTVDVRSRSRAGFTDFGMNAKRISEFLNNFNLTVAEYKKTVKPVIAEVAPVAPTAPVPNVEKK